MGKRIRKILSALAAAFLLTAPGAAVGAADGETDPPARAYAVTGYDSDDRPVLAPFADRTTAATASRNAQSFLFTEDNWTAEGNVYRTRLRSQLGMVSAYAVLEQETPPEGTAADATVLTFDLLSSRLNMDGYNAIYFGLQMEGSGVYPVSLELTTVSGTVRAEVTAQADDGGEWNLITADMTEAKGRLLSMTISVETAGNAIPATISVAQPYAVTKLPDGFGYSERYATDLFETAFGRMSMQTGQIQPDEHGSVYLSGRLVTDEALRIGAEGYFEIHLSGVTSGNMTLGVLYAGAEEEQRVFGRKVSLNAPDGVYTIPVAVYDMIESYSLQFDNLKCDGTFRLDGVRVYSGREAPASGNAWLGSVSSVTREGNEIRFAGTMERAAAAQYDGQRIRFCAIPGWQANDLSAAVEIGSTKVTTRFEYTADLTGTNLSGSLSMFFAAILAEDGTYLPLSRPRYADAQSPETDSASVMGLYQAAPVGVFESNVTHVLVDVPLDELLTGTEEAGTGLSATYTVYDGEESRTEIAAFRREFLDELDSDLEFYLSAGIRVYLRLLCASPVEGLTFGGEGADNYAVDFTRPENRYRYAAVVRFLAERYPKTAGFVLGMGVNAARTVGDADLTDTAKYVVDLADVCRITYNAASPYAENIIVALPFTEKREDDGENGWISDRTLAVMLSNRLRDVGTIPWAFLYCIDSAADSLAPPVSLSKLLSDLEISGPASVMYFCELAKLDLIRDYRADCELRQAEGEEIPAFREYTAQVFDSFWEACQTNRALAAFQSMKGTSMYNDRGFYSILKKSVETGGVVFESRAQAPADEESFAGSCTVWDFSDKYYPMDWIAGGGVASCTTGYSELFSRRQKDGENRTAVGYCRTLQAELESQNGGCAGITMCNLQNAVDLTAADVMEVTFALTREETAETKNSGVNVVFVIGTDEVRAEYYADSLSCGQIYTLSCDLSEYEYRAAADYIGVMVYADSGVTLELSSVTLRSREASDEELRKLFLPKEQETPADPDAIRIGFLCAVIFVLSAAAFVILNRRDNEAEELRAAEEAGQRRTERREYRS